MIVVEKSRHPAVVIRLLQNLVALRLPVPALLVFAGLSTATLALIAFSLTQGSYEMSVQQVFETLFAKTDDQLSTIVWEFRFPRTLVAALVGAMLALSGATLQNVTRNGLADPSLVGISQGAGLAVVAMTVLWPDQWMNWRPVFAFAGSLLVAAIIQMLSGQRGHGGSIRFILMGIGIAAFVSAITSALLTYGNVNRAMAALAWLAGSIHTASWGDVKMLALWSAVLLPLLLSLSRSMSALQMGEATAIGLGVSASTLRIALIAISVGFAAIATAAIGPLGFIGLVAPHAARRLCRSGMGLYLLNTAALGAFLVTLADLLGRTLFAPIQIPAGLVTAVFGAPLFIVLLQRNQSKGAL